MMPDASPVAVDSAACADSTKISAVTSTEPTLRVSVTALVETPAALAKAALIEVLAASS